MGRPGSGKRKFVMFLPWSPLPPGGVNNVVNGLAGACRGVYDPVIVVTSWTRPDDYRGEWLALPYPKFGRPLGFMARLVPTLIRLRGLLKGAVVANAHFGGLECVPLILLRKLGLSPQVILSVHGADVTEMLETKGGERRAYRWMLESADLVVGCSRNLAEKVRGLAPKARITAIQNATADPPAEDPGRPLEMPYLLCVAAFVEKKAHSVLIAAFRQIHERFPDLHLVLVGSDGPTRRGIETLIAESGAERVHILLSRPNAEIWNWMRHTSCFVLPSRDEPFGIVLLEAGKSKAPIVATRVGGVPEFLTDKQDGLLCDPDDPDQLAAAISTTLEDASGTAARVASFYAKAAQFTWAETFAQYRKAAGI